MEKKIILVDQDGVLADQHGYFLHLLKTLRPDIFSSYRGALMSYEIEENFAPEYAEEIKSLRSEREFFASLPAIPGGKEALLDLQAAGHEVRICTAPIWNYHFCVPEKLAWIEKHIGREFASHAIITRDKTIVRGNILIDDKPSVSGLRTPEWEHVLYDQPYNVGGTKKRLNWQNYNKVLGL